MRYIVVFIRVSSVFIRLQVVSVEGDGHGLLRFITSEILVRLHLSLRGGVSVKVLTLVVHGLMSTLVLMVFKLSIFHLLGSPTSLLDLIVELLLDLCEILKHLLHLGE